MFTTIEITTGYYADGEPTDGWHWYAKRGDQVVTHGGPFRTERLALDAGYDWLRGPDVLPAEGEERA